MQWANEQVCQWFAVSMLHVLWQAFIPFGVWLACNRGLADRPHARYVSGLVALAAIAACLPINLYYFRDVASLPNTQTAVSTQAPEKGFNITTSTAAQTASDHNPLSLNDPIDRTYAANEIVSSTPHIPAKLYSWFVGFYFVGVLFFSVRMLAGSWQTHRLRGRCQKITQPHVLGAIERAMQAAKLVSGPAVLWCDAVAVPALVGVIKPMILMPLHCASELSVQQIESIVLHELSHFRRCDPILNMLQNAIEAIFFFHPVVWYISKGVRLDRELSCDKTVVEAGHQAEDYALSLVQLARLGKRSRVSSLIGIASTGTPSQLQIRIRSLLNQRQRVCGGGLSFICGTLLIVGLLAISVQMLGHVQAQDTLKPAQVSEESSAQESADSKPGEVFGTVVDADGKPIAGATVDLFTWIDGQVTMTDDQGKFRLPDNKSRHVEMAITKDGYAPFYSSKQATDVPIKVALDSSTYLEGAIYDFTGKLVPDTQIIVYQSDSSSDDPRTRFQTKTKSDAAGQFRVYVSQDNNYIVMHSPGRGSYYTAFGPKFERPFPRGHHRTVPVLLQPPVRFEAQIVDSESGAPVSGIHLFNQDAEIGGTSDENGKVVIDDLWSGQLTFGIGQGDPVLKKSGIIYEPKTINLWWSDQCVNDEHRRDSWARMSKESLVFRVIKDMEPVLIKVEQFATFRGTIYDPDGKPVAGATVAPVDPENRGRFSTRHQAKTNSDGSYELHVPAGKSYRYNLMAHDGDFRQWRTWANGISDAVESQPGQVIDNLDIHLNRPAGLRGRIIAVDDRSPEGCRVVAYSSDQKENPYYAPTTTAKADGTFELNFIREGKHSLQISSSNESITIDLVSGQVLDGIELKMPGPGERSVPEMVDRKFQITLQGIDGKPLANQKVIYLPYAGLSVEWPLFGSSDEFDTKWRVLKSRCHAAFTTDAQGQFEFDGDQVFNAQINDVTLMAFDSTTETCSIHRLYADIRNPQATMQMMPLRRVHFESTQSPGSMSEISLTFRSDQNLRVPRDRSGELEPIFLPAGHYQLAKRSLRGNYQDRKPSVQDFVVAADEKGSKPTVVVLQ
jgi:beta-lactamase regulating signal transducer with metallopeptidase domain